MASYILSHDFGTTGDKGILVDEEGKIKASYSKSYKSYSPHSDWIEQKPSDWWNTFCEVTRNILDSSKVRAEDISVVSITGTQPGCVPVDKKGRVLREKTILHSDLRAKDQAEKLVSELGGFGEFYKIHGIGIHPEQHSTSKIMWLKDNEPGIYDKTYKFLQNWSFIVFRLTGEFSGDYGGASSAGWLDIKKREYSEEILEVAGIDLEKLPDLFESSEIVGSVDQRASRKTGLEEGTPVVAGSGDTQCSAIGAGVVEEKRIYCYLGSAHQTGTYSDKCVLDPENRMSNFIHPDPGKIMPYTFVHGGGTTVDWFIRNFVLGKNSGDSEEEDKMRDIFERKAEEVPVGCRGLVFLPYIHGGGGPHWRRECRGTFSRISAIHTKSHFYRAVLEGIAFALRWALTQIEDAGFPVLDWGEVRIIGGGSKSKVLTQIYADLFDTKLSVMERPLEGTTLGSAMIGGVGVGIWENYKTATEEVLGVGRTVEPNSENNKIYQENYGIFKRLFDSVIEVT